MELADAGIPMLAWHIGPALLVFFPIVMVESVITWAFVRQPVWPVVRTVGVANAISTFVGIPMAWIFMVVLELATVGGGADRHYNTPFAAFQSLVLGAAWLPPEEGALAWLIPAATLVLLIPYFVVSVAIERRILLKSWSRLPRSGVTTACWLSNLASYSFLFAWAVYDFYHVSVAAQMRYMPP